MVKVSVPTVESVARLARERAGPFTEPNTQSRSRPSGRVWNAIVLAEGEAATGTGLDSVSSLFKVELLDRVWLTPTTYTWKRTGTIVQCFNDFTANVSEDKILKVVRDATTEHYQIVVWDCN